MSSEIKRALEGQHVIVFGGSSGIGEATAGAAAQLGARVTIVARDRGKLDAAAQRTGARPAAVDATDRDAVDSFFAQQEAIDHLVLCQSGGSGAGPFVQLDLANLRGAFEAKTFAQLAVAQVAARRMKAGSLTLVTAGSARSKIRGTSGLAAVNGALEAMIPILALELAPVRVNAVSPGIIDTPWWNGMPAEAKAGYFKMAETALPVRRVGTPADVAAVILLLLQNGFVTGSVYECDGGHHLVTQ